MKHTIFHLICFVSFLTGFLSCSNMSNDKPIVTVTIQPQKYFAEKIAGDKFDINCIVPNGSSPESYDPSPSHLVYVGKSKAYFKIGYIGFEMAWLDKLMQNNPSMKLFDNSKGVHLLSSEHVCTDERVHLHNDNIDPHIWSSPKQAAIIAKNMYEAFVELDPKHKEYFTENYNELLSRINEVDSIMTAKLSTVQGKSFAIYHPSLSYLANDYGLKQISIELNGKEPSPFHLKSILDIARKDSVKILFIQKEFDIKNAQLFASEAGCKVVEINPLNYNWDQEFIKITDALSNE